MMERYIYSDERVSISTSVAVLDDTQYSIAAISDLFIIDRRPNGPFHPKTQSPIFSVIYSTAIFATAVMLVIYSCQISEPANTGPSFASFFILGTSSIMLITSVIWAADRIACSRPPESEQNLPDYTLVIATAAGHRSAISSADRWYIERIEGCIEYSIALSARAQKRSSSLCSIS